MKKISALVFLPLLLIGQAAHGKGADVDTLLKEKKYLSAAREIRENAELFATPKGFMRFVDIVVTYRASTQNFHAFSMKDLEPGESLEDARRMAGATTLVEPDMEELLYERYAANPDSPEVNFAVGEYLSRMAECDCGQPKLFTGEAAYDVQYFNLALSKGIYDYWSLFRLGLEFHYAGDYAHAADMYRRARAENPAYIPASYNLGVVLLTAGDPAGARAEIEPILDKYPDDYRNSDVHHIMAKINLAQGMKKEAEEEFLKALRLNPTHEIAGPDYMDFLKKENRKDDYKKFVMSFLAADFSTPYTFNIYLDYIMKGKPDDFDRSVFGELEKLSFSESMKIGALNFNLGRLALFLGEKVKALDRFRLSKSTFEHMKNPPDGALAALNSLIEQTEKLLAK